MTLGMIPEGSGIKCYDCNSKDTPDCEDSSKLTPVVTKDCGSKNQHCTSQSEGGKVTSRECLGDFPDSETQGDCSIEVLGNCAKLLDAFEKRGDVGKCVEKAGGKARTARMEQVLQSKESCVCKGELCNSGWMKSFSVLLLTTAVLVASGATHSSWLGA